MKEEYISPLSGDVDIIAETGESVVATCIAYGSPSPEISWSLQQNISTSNTNITTTSDSSVYTNQLVRNGVGIVYSSLLLCPGHPGTLTTSQVSCRATNGVDGGNVTSHSFLVNVSGRSLGEGSHSYGFFWSQCECSLMCKLLVL